MKAIISVIGKDKVGILSAVSGKCAEYGVNIEDVSQTILQDMFTMIMLLDISTVRIPFGDFAVLMKDFGKEIGMEIRVMHEDIFNSMHRI